MQTRRVFLSAMVSVAALLGSAKGFAVDPVKAAKVGVILPMTGDAATFGQESMNGLKLAMDKLGQTAPVLDIVLEDTQGTPKGSAEAINKLITTNKVQVVIGEVKSSDTLAASAAAEDKKIPLLTHASTNDTITKGKNFVSRICFIDSFQGEVMARFASGTLKAKTAMIIVDSDSDYSRGLQESFRKAFSKSGKIVAEVAYSAKDTDFTAQLTKVRKEKPDVVFVPGYYGNVGAILRQAKELKITAKMLGADGWDSPDLFKVAGKDAAPGHYISSHFAPDDTDPKVQAFVKEYKAKFNVLPGAMAALGYDAGMFIHSAIKKANSTESAKIQEAISGTKGFDGITGKISLDANRNAVKSAVILETTDAGFKFHSRVNQ